ncbi:MAG: TM2 domain-containing protein [Methylococcales bacterium]
MIGQIERYASDTPTVGVIKSDGVLYDFNVKVWRSRYAPMVGDDVEFQVKAGKVTQVKPLVVYAENMQPVKSRMTAAILGLLLGAIGAHRLYLGFYATAAIQIAFTLLTGGFGLLWGFIEGFLILTGHMDKDAQGRALK